MFYLRVCAVYNRDKYIIVGYGILWLSVVGMLLTLPFTFTAVHIATTQYCGESMHGDLLGPTTIIPHGERHNGLRRHRVQDLLHVRGQRRPGRHQAPDPPYIRKVPPHRLARAAQGQPALLHVSCPRPCPLRRAPHSHSHFLTHQGRNRNEPVHRRVRVRVRGADQRHVPRVPPSSRERPLVPRVPQHADGRRAGRRDAACYPPPWRCARGVAQRRHRAPLRVLPLRRYGQRRLGPDDIPRSPCHQSRDADGVQRRFVGVFGRAEKKSQSCRCGKGAGSEDTVIFLNLSYVYLLVV